MSYETCTRPVKILVVNACLSCGTRSTSTRIFRMMSPYPVFSVGWGHNRNCLVYATMKSKQSLANWGLFLFPTCSNWQWSKHRGNFPQPVVAYAMSTRLRSDICQPGIFQECWRNARACMLHDACMRRYVPMHAHANGPISAQSYYIWLFIFLHTWEDFAEKIYRWARPHECENRSPEIRADVSSQTLGSSETRVPHNRNFFREWEVILSKKTVPLAPMWLRMLQGETVEVQNTEAKGKGKWKVGGKTTFLKRKKSR